MQASGKRVVLACKSVLRVPRRWRPHDGGLLARVVLRIIAMLCVPSSIMLRVLVLHDAAQLLLLLLPLLLSQLQSSLNIAPIFCILWKVAVNVRELA